MVYDKARSGDPDYDDKVPLEQHSGGVVSAGDGVWISKVNGPIDAEGAHVNLAVDETDLDNRPEPGGHATKPSEVQQYSPDDTPTLEQEADPADVEHIKSGQASVRIAAEAAGQTGTAVLSEGDQADESKTRSADVSAAKTGSASAAKKATPSTK